MRPPKIKSIRPAAAIEGGKVIIEGTGFDPEAALAARVSSGLSGMRERAALLGGRVTIESTPGAGAHLTAEFPLGHNSESTNEQNTDRFG